MTRGFHKFFLPKSFWLPVTFMKGYLTACTHNFSRCSLQSNFSRCIWLPVSGTAMGGRVTACTPNHISTKIINWPENALKQHLFVGGGVRCKSAENTRKVQNKGDFIHALRAWVFVIRSIELQLWLSGRLSLSRSYLRASRLLPGSCSLIHLRLQIILQYSEAGYRWCL